MFIALKREQLTCNPHSNTVPIHAHQSDAAREEIEVKSFLSPESLEWRNSRILGAYSSNTFDLGNDNFEYSFRLREWERK